MRPAQLLAALLMTASWQSAFPDDTRIVPIQFKKGTSSAVLQGQIRGWEMVEYRLNARADQIMDVTLQSSNIANFFNITAPSAEIALFIGADQGTHYQGVLPTDGTYQIQHNLIRNEARRGEQAKYRVKLSITPWASRNI